MSGMSPAFPGLSDRKDSGILGTLQWDTWDMSRMSPPFPGLWDGKDTSTLQWDTRDMSGISPAFPGLWDGKDSGILGTLDLGHLGHVWDVPSIPRTLGWEGH